MMIRLFLLLLMFSSFAKAEEVVYISGFEDLPLMEGLEESADGSLVFDSLEGKIVQSYLVTSLKTTKEIEDYYAKTLPGLGWKKIKKNKYKRDDGTLSLEIVQKKNPVIVKFELH